MKAKVPSQYNKSKLRAEIGKELSRMEEEALKAFEEKIGRELAEAAARANEAYEFELDALVLWTLHVRFGFGYKRLSAFYEALFEERQDLHERYLPNNPSYGDNGVETDAAYQRLRDFGFDVRIHYDSLSKRYPLRTFKPDEEQ